MSANIKASTDGTQAIIGVGGVDQMTVSNAGVVTANSFVGLNNSSVTATGSTTARTLANRFADVVNVKDFGAVGDGVTDDTAAISSAISSGNKRIFFPQGIYIVSHIYKYGLTGIELFGVIGKSVIKKKAGTYSVNIDGAISGIIDFVSCSDISLHGIKFDGNKTYALPTAGTHLNGINFYQCNIVRTENCEFVDIEFQGLNHQCTYQAWVTDNKFLLCGWSGIGFTGGYFNIYGAESCIIANNYFESIWAGVQCQISTTYVNIENNIFRNSSLIFAQDVRYANISNNTFDGPAPSGALGEAPQDAITIESDYNITITSNTINGSARHGIYVVGNYIENGPNEGILVCNDIVISSNIITNSTADGINFTPGSAFTYNMVTHTATPAAEINYTYAKNSIIGNNIISFNEGSGIILGIAQNVKVDGNTIAKNINNGIVIGSNKSVFIGNNSISNNSYLSPDIYDGILVNNSVSTLINIVIDGNNIFDDQNIRTQRYGIYNPNILADIKILNNIFKNNGTNLSSSVLTLPFEIQNSPIFLNGASPFGGGFETPSYYIDNDGIVHLRGVIQLGASGVGNPIFTLPLGMRPKYNEMFVVLANNLLGRCDILSNGNVVAVNATNNQWLNLSGISFAANR